MFDLCIAWEWEYDGGFVQLLDTVCSDRGYKLLQVTPQNISEVEPAIQNQEISIGAFLDRASDTDERFLPLIEHIVDEQIFCINSPFSARRSWNKAYTHQVLTEAGLQTPPTQVIPSFSEQPDLPVVSLEEIGPVFTIKPAHGGGGKGVHNEATSWEQILAARQEYPYDQYLLQTYLVPAQLDGRRAWFRTIYCAGRVFTFWWDTSTHVYTLLTQAEEQCFQLQNIKHATQTIAQKSSLNLFSTEMAYMETGELYVVDYINDPIDLRMQSQTVQGVPDETVAAIAYRLVELAVEKRNVLV